MTGTIPQSDALSEASPSSISELMSRNPLSLSKDDRLRIVRELRAQRARWEAAEAAGKHVRAPKADAKSLITSKTSGDLGL